MMRQQGFSAVELLITLFIAAIFLSAGYQLWGFVQKAGEESSQLAKASNVAYDYLKRYTTTNTNSCTPSNPVANATPTPSTDLPNAKISVVISCPYTGSSVQKVVTTLTYGKNPTKSVSHATYGN